MATTVFLSEAHKDEGFFSAHSDGSLSPTSSSSDSQSHFSETRSIEIEDHRIIMLSKETQPGLFSEQGHMVYMPCIYCTLYCKDECSQSNFTVKHRNHVYINHWVFFRCSQCKDNELNDSLREIYSNDCLSDLPCPLQYLKRVAYEYIQHGKTCLGGSSCTLLKLCPEKYSCCHRIAFAKTTLKKPALPLNMKERLSLLPQVEFPAKVHVKHACATDPCVDQNLLEEALHRIGCKLTGEVTSGTFSNVYNAQSKPSNAALCIKATCLHKAANNATFHSVETEIFVSNLKHEESTPVLFHYGSFRLKDTIFMVSEQAKNGNLAAYLDRVGDLGEKNYRNMVTVLCCGLHFLHTHSIAHRNLTLENILVSENPTDLKIAGLGSSCKVQLDRLTNQPFVSYQYAAPEFFQTRCFDPLKPDIWSLGVVMFYLFNRRQLFPNSSISPPRGTPILNWGYSFQSKRLLDLLLTREYNLRPNIKKVLEHPWLHPH